MIKLKDRYGSRTGDASLEYPNGTIVNESYDGANDGTPLDQARGNDIEGFYQALMIEGGVTPSGDPDTALASDRLDAMKNIIEAQVAIKPVDASSVSTTINGTATDVETYLNAINVDDIAALRASLVAGDISPGASVYVKSTGGPNFIVEAESGQVDDGGYTVVGGSFAAIRNANNEVGLIWFEPANNGSTDDTAEYQAAKAAADALGVSVNIDRINIVISSDQEVPNYGFVGTGTITGAGLTVTQNRKAFNQKGKLFCDEITFSGAQYCKTEWIESVGPGNPINLDGNSSGWGTFWNNFGTLIGNINIDCDKGQSINQNNFEHVRGHVHIFGTATTGFRECDQNTFEIIDSTNADITAADGTTGWHMLNESDLNQRNVVKSWYAEGTGKRSMRGNFHVLSAYIDSAQSPYANEPTNHILFNPDHSSRNRGDYLSAPLQNGITGGCWDVLNATAQGQPLNFVPGGGFPDDVYADATEPTGLGYKWGGITATDFQTLSLRLESSVTGQFSLFVWVQVLSGGFSFSVNNNGSAISHGSDVYHDAGNGWRLYRISGECRDDGGQESFQFQSRNLTDPNCEIYIGAAWATPYKASFLPTGCEEEKRVAVSTDGTINKADALPVGGRIENRNPSLGSGNNAEWVKISGGTFSVIATVP